VYRQHMRKRRGVRLAIAMAALCTLATTETALAGTDTVRDRNDRPGPLDIRSASQGHSGTKVTHTIRTFANWPIRILGPSTPNFFSLEINTDRDRALERVVVIFSTPGRMIAGVFTRSGSFLGRAGASRPNAHTVKVTIRRGLLGSPPGYRWRALSFFRSPSPCGGGCLDRAPRLAHDIAAPTVSFPQPPPPVSTSYNLDFTVGDIGGSRIASWRLEQRDVPGPAPWTLVDNGTGPGPQSVPFTEAQSGDTDEFRVIAVDRHGNRTVSPIRAVTVP
jgi:hypothetical protein